MSLDHVILKCVVLVFLGLCVQSCETLTQRDASSSGTCTTGCSSSSPVTFQDMYAIVSARCNNCHTMPSRENDFLMPYNIGGGGGIRTLVDVTGNLANSPLYTSLTGAGGTMPESGGPLSTQQIATIRDYILGFN